MLRLDRKLSVALLLCSAMTNVAYATSSAPAKLVFTEDTLFSKEKSEPLSVWTGAAADGSRKTIEIKASDGVILRGWSYEADPKGPIVITFRGNNETIADAFSQSRDTFFYTRLNTNVVTFDYRGTGFSTGKTSLQKALSDSLQVYDEVIKRAAGRPVFVCGWSLGSIFASHVAGNRPSLAGLILLDPIASAEKYAEDMRKYANVEVSGPPSFELIQNAKNLGNYHQPLLIVHGTADPVVPISQGRDDFEAASSKDKTFVPVDGKGHNGAIWSLEADNAISTFILKHAVISPVSN